MPRAFNVNKAFSETQLTLLKSAPFHITVWEGRVMGGYPANVPKRALTACLAKHVLYGTQEGIRIVYRVTDFGKDILTLLEAQGKMALSETEKPDDPQ